MMENGQLPLTMRTWRKESPSEKRERNGPYKTFGTAEREESEERESVVTIHQDWQGEHGERKKPTSTGGIRPCPG